MDPNPRTFPILSYVMSRLPSLTSKTAAANASDSDNFDIEQPPPSDPSSSSPSLGPLRPEIVDQLPHLEDPKLLASMGQAIADVAQARSVLNLIGERPTHEEVDNARAELADLEARLSRQLEEIVLEPRPADVDIHTWRARQAEGERWCREEAEKERRVVKSVIQLDEMHDAYEKLLRDAEKRLVRIYEGAEEGGGDDGGGEEANEEVAGILQEAYGRGMERVDLSGRRLRLLPEAFGRVSGLVVLDVSGNQLSVRLIDLI